MPKGDPCNCGSVYFRDWHLLSSSWFWPRQHLHVLDLQTFLATVVASVGAPRAASASIHGSCRIWPCACASGRSSASCGGPTWKRGAG